MTHPNMNGVGNTYGIIPSGRQWNVELPWSSNVDRSFLDKTETIIRTALWPADYVTNLLPYLITLERRQNTGDTVSVWVTERLQGILHFNVAHNHRLTLGVVKQTKREIEFTSISTDCEELATPAFYQEKFPLDNPQFIDEMKRIWSAAHGRVIEAYEAMARWVLRRDLATIWNMSTDAETLKEILRSTYWVCNRMPNDAVTAIMTCLTATALAMKYRADQVGKVLLLPVQAVVEKSVTLGNQAMSQYDKERQVERTLTAIYRISDDQVVGVPMKTQPSLIVNGTEVVFYDTLTSQSQVKDPFSQTRIFGSAVNVCGDVARFEIKTPNGSRVITSIDLAISAGMFHPGESLVTYGMPRILAEDHNLTQEDSVSKCFANQYYEYLIQQGAAKEDGPGAYRTAFPSIAGSYAFQTAESARLLVRWLSSIIDVVTKDARSVRLTEAAVADPNGLPDKTSALLSAILRNTGVKFNITGAPGLNDDIDYAGDDAAPAPVPYLNFVTAILNNSWHSFLKDVLFDPDDEINAMVALLCALPGTRLVAGYLHSVVPFTFCNFVYFIVGSATSYDGYVLQKKPPVHCISSDNTVGTFTDPQNYSTPRYNIGSRFAMYTHSTDLNVRIPDVLATNRKFDASVCARPGEVPRRQRSVADTPGQYDTFAVFSGVGDVLPKWCKHGWDSIIDMPTQEEIMTYLFPGGFMNSPVKNKIHERSVEMMTKGLEVGDWHVSVQDDEDGFNQTTDAPNRKWYAWPATMYTSDGATHILPGLRQMETYQPTPVAMAK